MSDEVFFRLRAGKIAKSALTTLSQAKWGDGPALRLTYLFQGTEFKSLGNGLPPLPHIEEPEDWLPVLPDQPPVLVQPLCLGTGRAVGVV